MVRVGVLRSNSRVVACSFFISAVLRGRQRLLDNHRPVKIHIVGDIARLRRVAGVGENKLTCRLEFDVLLGGIAKNIGSVIWVIGLHFWIGIKTLEGWLLCSFRFDKATVGRARVPSPVVGSHLELLALLS